jgi:hypothetical protein
VNAGAAQPFFPAGTFPNHLNNFKQEQIMANTANDMPTQNRSASEIDFVLRHAKHRRGPDVLRDLARAENEPPPARPEKKPRAPRRSKTII